MDVFPKKNTRLTNPHDRICTTSILRLIIVHKAAEQGNLTSPSTISLLSPLKPNTPNTPPQNPEHILSYSPHSKSIQASYVPPY